MKSYDIFLAIFIFIIFIICNVITIILSVFGDIKKNWPKYRCNPLIMPLAGYFGYDPVQNFAKCIGEMQKGMMSFFTNPLDMQMFGMFNIFEGIGESLNSFREMAALLKNGFGLNFLNIFGIFGDVVGYFQRLLIIIRDTIYKILATVTIFVNIGVSMQNAGDSLIAGPIWEALNVSSMGQFKG